VDSEESDGNALYLMTKVDPSEVADKQQITYAGIWVSDTVRSQAVKFNKSQDKYQIVIKDYSAEDEPYTKMNADLVAGDVPDIIELTGLDSEKYISKGMLEDLYTYMDKDADINKEDFIDNIIEVMETDGKLYHISRFLA
jgi:ABC-type glycerol-3-phosphate transport system substrate-binding protein